VKEVKLQRSI